MSDFSLSGSQLKITSEKLPTFVSVTRDSSIESGVFISVSGVTAEEVQRTGGQNEFCIACSTESVAASSGGTTFSSQTTIILATVLAFLLLLSAIFFVVWKRRRLETRRTSRLSRHSRSSRVSRAANSSYRASYLQSPSPLQHHLSRPRVAVVIATCCLPFSATLVSSEVSAVLVNVRVPAVDFKFTDLDILLSSSGSIQANDIDGHSITLKAGTISLQLSSHFEGKVQLMSLPPIISVDGCEFAESSSTFEYICGMNGTGQSVVSLAAVDRITLSRASDTSTSTTAGAGTSSDSTTTSTLESSGSTSTSTATTTTATTNSEDSTTSTRGGTTTTSASTTTTTTSGAVTKPSAQNTGPRYASTWAIGGPHVDQAWLNQNSGVSHGGYVNVYQEGGYYVLDRISVDGTIRVKTNNIIIRDCRVQNGDGTHSGSGFYAVDLTVPTPAENVIIEYSEFIGTKSAALLITKNVIVQYCYFHDLGQDTIKGGTDTLIRYNYFGKCGLNFGLDGIINTPDDGHVDTVQLTGGTNNTYQYNFFDDPYPVPSNEERLGTQVNFQLHGRNSAVRDTLIEYNWFNGPHVCFLLNGLKDNEQYPVENTIFRGNEFTQNFKSYLISGHHQGITAMGNRWSESVNDGQGGPLDGKGGHSISSSDHGAGGFDNH